MRRALVGSAHALCVIAIAPLLLAQALYVKRVTPRLAEPQGVREGIEGDGPALRLLIVGDSAAAGVGVQTQAEALSGQLVQALARHRRVSWKLIAKTGFTSKDILQHLHGCAGEQFDVAVTSIGVNDVTGGLSASKWTVQQHELMQLLIGKFGVRHVVMSGVPPLHLFPALPQPLRWYLGTRAAGFNQKLQGATRGNAVCEFAPPEFNNEHALMASDGFHPGAAGYALWAAHLADTIARRAEPSVVPDGHG